MDLPVAIESRRPTAGTGTPDWVKHAVFYQIFPDRFAKSDRLPKPGNLEPWNSDPTAHGYKGGDLLGVVEHLDYLQDLGVTALYFNPIFQSTANHRYHTHDYFRVDPLLGGDEALEELLDACHRRDIRVVLDGVFNHASRGFFQFNDVLENGAASPWLDWFTFKGFPANAYDHHRPPDYEAWFKLHALPKLNTDNPQVREYLMRVGEYWIRRGIDGWRLDVPEEIRTPGFWQEFRQRVKAINPNAYIVGEIWHEAREWLQGDQFDGVMNYLFTGPAIAFSGRDHVVKEAVVGRSYAPWPGIDAPNYAAKVDRVLGLYPWEIQLTQLNLLDSHDTSRFLSIAGGDLTSVKLGALLMFTFPGAPCIYYGDEIGMTGVLPAPWVRQSFPWDPPETWDHDLLHFYKSLIALRRSREALRTGDYTRLYAEGDVYACARSLGDARLVVVVNTAEEAREALVPLPRLAARRVSEIFSTGDAPCIQVDGSRLRLTMPPRSGAVLDAPAG
ncbi:MAG TPA: glycoside hydrolase family 13 protein [Thermomicrobiales bacterium]|nr:glycoside hydrolase family 13 protein [Thermomicrobiales bacterium]